MLKLDCLDICSARSLSKFLEILLCKLNVQTDWSIWSSIGSRFRRFWVVEAQLSSSIIVRKPVVSKSSYSGSLYKFGRVNRRDWLSQQIEEHGILDLQLDSICFVLKPKCLHVPKFGSQLSPGYHNMEANYLQVSCCRSQMIQTRGKEWKGNNLPEKKQELLPGQARQELHQWSAARTQTTQAPRSPITRLVLSSASI